MRKALGATLVPVLFVAFSLGWPSDGVAQTPEKPPAFVGKRILIKYDSGLELKAHYRSATQLTWENLTGRTKGQQGTEAIHAVEVAPNVFFISWLEKSGVSVSNVVDLRNRRVSAFITFDAGQGRQAMLDKGTLTEVAQ